MDTARLISVFVQAGSFIAAFAAIAAGIIMSSVTKKFGTGILANGFKSISLGVFLIASGIIIDALLPYIQIQSSEISGGVMLLKEALFVAGTYVIVIGSKNTGDKLESLTK